MADKSVKANNGSQSIGLGTEDVVGLSLNSLRTLADLYVRPNTVFNAFANGGDERYAPTVKIWLGLMGINSAVLALWGGLGDAMQGRLQADPQQMAAFAEQFGDKADVFLARYLSNYETAVSYFAVPLVGVFTALSVFLLKPFNRALSFPTRFNIAFGILSTGSLVGIFVFAGIVLGYLGLNWSFFAVPLVYFVTFWRGAPGIFAQKHSIAFFKSLLFSGCLAILVLAAYSILATISVLLAAQSLNG